ncbi:MAG: SCO family protein [Gloeobacteraceae cyanobacterium ES-bin-316]|nr:SCO family protein [Ferruginibacter sp.]
MKNKLWIYLGFFAVLLSVFYFFIFKDYDFSASRLAVINPLVPAFKFVNQDGKVFTQSDTDDKVYVTEYFFTTCEGICPKMNANMRRIFDQYKDNPQFLIVSHTCMPEVDSLPLLKAYEQKMLNGILMRKDDGSYKLNQLQGAADVKVNNTNWHFVTGDKKQLYEMARQGYMIDNGKPDSLQRIEDEFIHTQFFALVDKYRRVRGIYDGLKEEEIQKLMVDIKGLLKEKVAPKRFMTGFSNNPG